MTVTAKPVDNGINLEAILEARQMLTDAPEAAKFLWRASSTWRNGTHCYSKCEKFNAFGEDHPHRQEYGVDMDHPELFASEDNGATPIEIVMLGLAGCLTAGVASIATLREIQLRSVTATIEGDMDLLGVMGVDPDVRNGFSAVRVHFTIDADASQEDLEALVAQSQKRSAVYDLFTNPTNVVVDVNK
ncbi:MAG: OsmC family protein [Acidimicrobiales bacterium]|nr:OsmC family protein [Acidimicrobiales bacterium]